MSGHINADGEFQSDKYPTCPPGKVPLSVKDKAAQPLLWAYAQARRSIDAEFANDLETTLKAAGYAPPSMSEAIRDVLAERTRQVDVEGFDAAHDDEHTKGEIAAAAGCYALVAAQASPPYTNIARRFWPWDFNWWKPQSKRRNLVKAAALIIAEIERLDRRVIAEIERLERRDARAITQRSPVGIGSWWKDPDV